MDLYSSVVLFFPQLSQRVHWDREFFEIPCVKNAIQIFEAFRQEEKIFSVKHLEHMAR